MKYLTYRTFAALALAIFAAAGVFAQSDDQKAAATAAAIDKLVISAEAGGVNHTEGTVSIARKDGRSGVLLKRDSVGIGDVVTTGADGMAEILLNPGSFIRLGANSSFQFISTGLEDLQVKVLAGSAIFEVYAAREFKVTLKTPDTRVVLVESGVYRLDVRRGETRLSVWEGSARLKDTAGTTVDDGRAATVSGGRATVSKFDRGEKDTLDTWSKDRSKMLAKTTASLKNKSLRSAMTASLLGGAWDMQNSFGLWVFDPRRGVYCFLPFGYGWRSPYGYGFGNGLWYYDLPWGWGTYGWPPRGPVYSGPPTPPPGVGPTVTPVTRQGDRSPIPPFVRMGQADAAAGASSSPRGGLEYGSGNHGDYSGGSSAPTYTPPPPPPPPPATSNTKAGSATTKDN